MMSKKRMMMYNFTYPKLLIGILGIIGIFFAILKYFTPILIISFCIFFVLIYKLFKEDKKNIALNISFLALPIILILTVCEVIFNLPASSISSFSVAIFVIMILMGLILDRFINKKRKKCLSERLKQK